MKPWIRPVMILAAGASAAVPAFAAREQTPIPRSCFREMSFACGDSWATFESCMRYRADRLSERCQIEVKMRLAAIDARKRQGSAAAPNAAPQTSPAAP